MSALRLGSIAPDFIPIFTNEGESNKRSFHELIKDSWTILFSHPADFTPVCTTELAKLAQLQSEFEKRDVKLFGLSCDPIEEHHKWIKDINDVYNVDLKFPIIADADRKIAQLYDMLDYQDPNNKDQKGLPLTVRSVFIIDEKQTIRLILQYPTTVGRNFDEILRITDSLKLSSKLPVSTPANWNEGDEVIINNNLNDQEAFEKFSKDKIQFKTPYLRFTSI